MKIKRLIDFKEIKNFVIKQRGCNIDGVVFRLHYRATVIILFGFCLMVTAKQFFGTPMQCIPDREIKDEMTQYEKVVNRYCFIGTTFSVNTAWDKSVEAGEVVYPGIDKRVIYNSADKKADSQLKDTEVTFHAYYQWVWLVLLFQTIVFYLPHIFWKRSEGGLTHRLREGLDQYVMSKKERKEKVDNLAEYLLRSSGQHSYLLIAYSIAEVLNLANIVLQLLFVNRFLGGQFANYGLNVLSWNGAWTGFPLQYDPMMQVFPRMTKCTFYMFGSSGDVQKKDAFCVLPLNIVNEKGYLLVWFWFWSLLLITIVSLFYSLLLLLLPFLRVLTLKFAGGNFVAKRDVQKVLANSETGLGDYFLLHLLARNINTDNFGMLMHQLAKRMAEKEKML